ncbi:MAG: hypothetical protein RLZZ584_1979 [Pseudomonadota bacterium]|jgi:hypothetical protein
MSAPACPACPAGHATAAAATALPATSGVCLPDPLSLHVLQRLTRLQQEMSPCS